MYVCMVTSKKKLQSHYYICFEIKDWRKVLQDPKIKCPGFVIQRVYGVRLNMSGYCMEENK